MARRRLRRTDVIIITRVERGGLQEASALSFTLDSLSLSLRFIAWLVATIAATLTTVDRAISVPSRWTSAAYRLLFVGWSEDWPWIWLAIKSLWGGANGLVWA